MAQYVAISSSSTSKNKYFRPSGPNGELKLEEVVTTKDVMHEVVPSISQPGMIHLKCVDTGKFWSWDQNRAYISAQQSNPLSVLSSNACTLVKYSHHTSNGATAFHLEFRRNSKWHAIEKDSQGFLKSGESNGGSSYTNFVIEDWDQAARAIRNQRNAGDGKAGGNIININKAIIMIAGDGKAGGKNISNGPVLRLLDGKDRPKSKAVILEPNVLNAIVFSAGVCFLLLPLLFLF